MALSVAVDGALYPGERARAEALERRLRAEAIRKLGENRIAVDDPEGQDLRLEILESADGGVLVAISSPGAETNDFIPDAERLESERNALTEILPAEILAGPGDLERVALDIFDQAISGNWRADCDLSRAISANGRFAFELPPSHLEARDRYLSRLADDGLLDLSAPSRTGSLFERSADGEEERLSTFRLAEETLPERFLVADDGRFVVAFDLRQASQGAGFDRGRTLIYRSDGSVVSRLTVDDLLTSGDAQEIRRTRISSGFLSPFSASLDDDRNLLVLTIKDSTIPHEIAIDLETGRPLTPRRDLLPQMRVTISSSLPTSGLEPAWEPTVCVGESGAIEPKRPFAAPDLLREPPRSFYGHAVERPLPSYMEIAKRARLEGTVEVEVVVSETGDVTCARVTRLPMGLDRSAAAAALLWRFQPFIADGKPARAIGRFSFRFGLTDPPGTP